MSDKPLRVITPVAVSAQFWLVAPLVSALFSLFPAFFLAFIGAGIDQVFRSSPVGIILFAGGGYLLAFAVILWLFSLKAFQEPPTITYAIHADRVETEEGVFGRSHRTFLFDRVTDVTLTEGPFQQAKGVGTIQVTSGPALGQATMQRILVLRNVPDPRGTYELVRSLALKRSTERTPSSVD